MFSFSFLKWTTHDSVVRERRRLFRVAFLTCVSLSLSYEILLTNDKNFETYTHPSKVSYHKLTGCPSTNECRILERTWEVVLDLLTRPNKQKLSLTLSWTIFQTCHYKLSKEQSDPSVSSLSTLFGVQLDQVCPTTAFGKAAMSTTLGDPVKLQRKVEHVIRNCKNATSNDN
jgi:hypothetical protein